MFAMAGLGAPAAWDQAARPMSARPATHRPAANLQPLSDSNPTVTFSAAVYRGYETDSGLPITVTLSAAAVQTATVDYATSPGSALAGTDYTAVNGTLTFSPGTSSQNFNVPLLDNRLGQVDQTLSVTLSNPANATLGAPAVALVVIGDSETTTLTVTKSADTADGACELTDCSLREAIIAANAYPGSNTTNLPAGTYTLSLAGSNEDGATTGDLDVTDDLTLAGVTSATTVVATRGAAFGDRVFQVMPSVTMTATNITVTGGSAPASAGGGFYNQGTLSLINSTILSNTASEGGALYVYTGTVAIVDNSQLISNTSSNIGGAGGIYNAGVLTMTNSAILDTFGVGLHNNQGQVLVDRTIVSNSTDYGLLNDTGTMVITGSTITRNPGGGARNNLSQSGQGMTVINSLFSENSDNPANRGPGNSGASMTVINSLFAQNDNPNEQVGGGGVSNVFGKLVITNSTFVSNSAAGGGGGIFSYSGRGISIWQSTFADNTDGAIYNLGSGSQTAPLSINDSLFSNNLSPAAGAAIYNQADQLNIISTTFASNASTSVTFGGGAIYNFSWALRITDSTFYSNTSASSAGAVLNADGGGDAMSIINSTFSGNQAADNAGGIWVAGPALLNNVTVFGNTATHSHTGVGGGGLVVSPGVILTVTNSIIAGNQDLGSLAPDCAGTITSGGHNLIQSTVGCTLSGTASGDITGTAPLLGPLQDNGRPTWTLALLAGSPAIDAGSPAAPSSGGGACEAADQRGVARPQGLACDVGAFEAVGLSATGTVQFAGSAFSGWQSAGSVPIAVTLSRVMPMTVTVQYSTTDGTALAGHDYVAANGTLTFTPGLTQIALAVTLLPDGRNEPDETLTVTLAAPSNAILGAPIAARVTIHNDTPLPAVALSSSQYTVTESGGAAIITATLSAVSELTATAHYASSDGTALAGSDYTAVSGTLTFTPGLTRTTFTVPISPDTLHELNETFGVALSNPISASLGTPYTATVVIQDDDPLPGVSFSSAAYSQTESGGTAVITVTLSAASGVTATVHYASSDGTALAGSDYTAVSGTLVFAPGRVQQVITVPITNDVHIEGNETVQLTLSSPSHAVLGSPSAAILTIWDDDAAFREYLPAVAR